ERARARARAAGRWSGEPGRGAAPPPRSRLKPISVAKRTLWASLGLTPVVLVLNYVVHAGDVVMFVIAALALVPLAWLIGEATEHVAEHTGPGIGGFLNASFGNAPELIIAVLAI